MCGSGLLTLLFLRDISDRAAGVWAGRVTQEQVPAAAQTIWAQNARRGWGLPWPLGPVIVSGWLCHPCEAWHTRQGRRRAWCQCVWGVGATRELGAPVLLISCLSWGSPGIPLECVTGLRSLHVPVPCPFIFIFCPLPGAVHAINSLLFTGSLILFSLRFVF